MAHFYLDETLAAVAGDDVEILGSEAKHAVIVSRIGPGDRLRVGNGAGVVAEGTVSIAEAGRLVLRVERVEEHPVRRPSLVLVQALAKGDRDERAVQAATEVGVDVVIPWQSARSIVRWDGAKAHKGRERWQAIAREATKQSLRPWMPDVLDLVSTSDLVRLAGQLRILVLDPLGSSAIGSIRPDDRDIAIVVGPEGGIAPQEHDALRAAGAESVRLGPEVLRTSTAGPVALAVLSAAIGRWDTPAGRD